MDEWKAQMGKPCECEMPKIPKRTNCGLIDEIASELRNLDFKIEKLKYAIDVDNQVISSAQKELLKVQLNAMIDYKRALQNRIVNLIDTDIV